MDKVNGKLTLRGDSTTPHPIGTIGSLIWKNGFGNKVGAYPGCVCSVVASRGTGGRSSAIDDRMGKLVTTAFARK